MTHSYLPAVASCTGLHAVTARTLTDMPEEIMSGVISFTPDSVRALRVASHALERTGEGFLLSQTERIITACGTRGSLLDRHVYSAFVRLCARSRNQFASSVIRFHLSVPERIRALGVPPTSCPDRILSCGEISHFKAEVQRIQDHNLGKMWLPLHQGIVLNHRSVQLPEIGAPAHEIRIWMNAHQNLLPVLLDLSVRQLTCVPVELGLCRRMRNLDLSHNQLHSLPESLFSGLLGLQSLSLSHNLLHSLPEGLFSGLVGLQSLNLSHNQLHSFPEGLFSGLTSLVRLSFAFNQLTTLPAGLFHGLAGLDQLMVQGNPLLFSHDDFSPLNNLALKVQMDAFFHYRCRSTFAGLYQLAANSTSAVLVREAFFRLPPILQNAICRKVWVEAGCPQTPDPQWGEHHTFDDMGIFRRALLGSVRDSLEGLGDGQREAVYDHACAFARSDGESIADYSRAHHARCNILRLIDALMKQKELP